MKKQLSVFTACCILFLFVFALFMCWYIPSSASLRSKITETRQSLETSRGRESKQQDEYDKAVTELPRVQAQLEESLPLAKQAEETVSSLKARRKELRAVKKELEQKLSERDSSQEEKGNE